MASAPFHQNSYMKRRLFPPGVVAHRSHSPGYGASSRLAWRTYQTKSPSLSFVTVLVKRSTRHLALTVFAFCVLLSCATVEETKNAEKVAQTNVQLAVGYLKNGNYAVALEKIQRALAAQPDSVDAHITAALVYEALDKPVQADQHYQSAIDIAPENGSVFNNYGVFLCKNKRYREAVVFLVKAAHIPHYPSPERALENAGACARYIPDLDNAEEYLRQALSLNPKLEMALLEMAQVSSAKNKPMSTRAYLQRYEEVASHTPQSLWLGVVTEQKLGDQSAAARYAKMLQTKFPDSIEFKQLLEQSEQQRAGS